MTNPTVLSMLESWEPSAPRLTWYGDGDERVELSGKVLRNWVIKAANLLSMEADVQPDSVVLLDLPAHWRQLVWALAAWTLGAQVQLSDDAPPMGTADVIVSSAPQHRSAEIVIAVPLPALARSWEGELPAGALDGAAELMGQPDEPLFGPEPGPAVVDGPPRRVLLAAPDRRSLPDRAWQVWASGGSLVLATARSDAEIAQIATQEHATPA
ncbi:MAG: TIGR03089 family protein [Beutenbergiaceae bacterium]